MPTLNTLNLSRNTNEAINQSSDSSEGGYLLNEDQDKLSEAYSSWKTFKRSPRELWIILICKLFESFCFISEDFVFILFFSNEFNLSEYECGVLYSMTAGLTFIYGLFFSGYLIDTAGVKTCMLLGSLFLAITRILLVIIDKKYDLYLICATTFPLGLSMCKDNLLIIVVIDIPVMTLGIKKCTVGKTRSLAYSLFYAMLTTGLFLAGPAVDLIRTVVGCKFKIFLKPYRNNYSNW